MRGRSALAARGRDVLLAAAIGVVMAAGTVETIRSAPPPVGVVAHASVRLPACDPAGTAVTVGWDVDTSAAVASVVGVRLGNVPAACAALPITTMLLDASGEVLESAVNLPSTAGGSSPVTVTVDLHSTPVAIPPLYGIRADVPDPLGTAVALPAGSNAMAMFSDAGSGTVVMLSFASVAPPGGTVTGSVLRPGQAGYVNPTGFTLTSPPYYVRLASTATFSGPVTVCVLLDRAALHGRKPGLYHYDQSGRAWHLASTPMDSATGEMCGTVTSLGLFAVGVAKVTPTPTPTATPRPTPRSTPRPTATPRPSATASASPAPSASTSATPSPAPSASPSGRPTTGRPPPEPRLLDRFL
ncbi:MAG: hypothetical protein WCK58_19125, partial [Chloroflexota bacterium]